MIEAAFAQLGLPWRYLNLEVAPDQLADAVRGARAMGFRGFNLSMPHKVAVIPLLDGLGASARIIGAVNCVVRRGDRLIGENTDGQGFLASLREIIDPRGQNVVVLGAGGAARAIAVELALAGANTLTIVNRSEARGSELVKGLCAHTQIDARLTVLRGDYVVPADATLVINATSIGLYDATARVPVATDSLRRGVVVADVVFSPARTRWLRDAEARGCITLDGLGMLVNQGVVGVKYWTDRDADPAVMREALANVLPI
jgi:shikimate dehydrogenase